MSVEASDIWGSVINCESVDVVQLIQDLKIAYTQKLAATSSTLSIPIVKNISKVPADPNQLKRVFENLIGNALKYNPDGVDITLTVALSNDQSLLRCGIADNGVGIVEAQKHSLFGFYTRGPSERLRGHGLGLYICRKIVEAHGGRIDVNIPDQGVEFWFTLPL